MLLRFANFGKDNSTAWRQWLRALSPWQVDHTQLGVNEASYVAT